MNLFIVEDNELVLDQLRRLIACQPDIEVVGIAASEDAAVLAILDRRPDAVLLDLALATGNGVHVLQRIRKLGCTARVLVLTNHTSDIMRRSCAQFGIEGFYDKSHEANACLNHLFGWATLASGAAE